MDFEIKDSNNKKGLFALKHFTKNELLFKFKGSLLSKEDSSQLSNNQAANLLQIGRELYLNLTGDNAFFINHSCNPNTGVKTLGKVAALITLREIKPNEEITFDYSTTCNETDEEWSMVCNCKEWNCRKLISGFQYLTAKEKQYYLDLNVVPDYNK